MKKRKKIIFLFFLICSLQHQYAQNSYVDSLKKSLSVEGQDTNRIALLSNLSGEYMWSFADTGKMYAQDGLKLSKKLNYKYGEAQCSKNLCVSLMQEGDFTSALDYGFKALSIFENVRDSQNIALCHAILMICYREEGDYQEALVHGYKAKALTQFLSSDSINILGNISSVYEKNNQLDSALYYGLIVYSLDRQWLGELITLGNIYYKSGNPEKSLYYFRKAIPSNTGWGLMDTYLGIAKTFELMGLSDSSLYYAQKSLVQSQKNGNPRGTFDAAKQLAHFYENKKMNDSAVKYLKLTMIFNDSLFSRQKTTEAQSFVFNEIMHRQELEAQQVHNDNLIKLYALSGIILAFLLVAFIQYRNNKHKQKVNIQLQKQKEKAEVTLQELRSTQAQLIQSEKMASLGELTAGIAHEIQNPLNFVNNFSEVNTELLKEMKTEIDKGNFGEIKSIANDIIDNEEKINHHGKRADGIVKGMLQHSRTSTGQKEPTDINSLADEYLRLAYHGLRAKEKHFNATIKTDFDTSIGPLNLVSQDIGRVLLNLYNNAFYAVSEKKKTDGGGFEPTVSVSTKKANDKIEISVKDNGGGIPQKILDKIFQPFFTTKPTGQGTGLGLSLAYDIIKAHVEK